MKKLLLAVALLCPALGYAHPGGWGPGHGADWHRGWGGAPHSHNFLPGAAAAVLIGGLTYYVLNGSYYQRQNDNTYVMVEPPREAWTDSMRALDYNGERFWVQDGHFYRRDISGRYLEVPRPPGL